MRTAITSKHILNFWFNELRPEQRFKKDKRIDDQIRKMFSVIHQQASLGELYHWRNTPEGRLAEIIILDQFSRNMFRDSELAFKNDIVCLVLAEEMVLLGLDKEIPQDQRAFVYMPYMHSESPVIHEKALELFQDLNIEDNLRYEILHKNIIDKFGRYPHRNKVLGRDTTPEEEEFLKTNPGF